MANSQRKTKNRLWGKRFSLFTMNLLLMTISVPFPIGYTQNQIPESNEISENPWTDKPGAIIFSSPQFIPAVLRGLTIPLKNPLNLNFILDTGDSPLKGDALNKESQKLITYFLTSLTIPEDEIWVNLSPYEKDRITTGSLGTTEMGRELLEQDYILKQFMASLTHPDTPLGKKFWERVYALAYQRFGHYDFPLNTFNKVWIVPQEVHLVEYNHSVYIQDSRLKIMMEEDYLSLQENAHKHGLDTHKLEDPFIKEVNAMTSSVIRDMLLKDVEREVNLGQNFAPLRQIFHSLILATWYKMRLKNTLLSRVYMDQNKTRGIASEDKDIEAKIYQQYVQAFQRGVYNLIQEEYDPRFQETIPKRYFSGGIQGRVSQEQMIFDEKSVQMTSDGEILGILTHLKPLITEDSSMLGERYVELPLWTIQDMIGAVEADRVLIADLINIVTGTFRMNPAAREAMRDYLNGRLPLEQAAQGIVESGNEYMNTPGLAQWFLVAARVSLKNKTGFLGTSFLVAYKPTLEKNEIKFYVDALQKAYPKRHMDLEALRPLIVEFNTFKNILNRGPLREDLPRELWVAAQLDAHFDYEGQAVDIIRNYLKTQDEKEKRQWEEQLLVRDSEERATYILTIAEYLNGLKELPQPVKIKINTKYLKTRKSFWELTEIFKDLGLSEGKLQFGDSKYIKELTKKGRVPFDLLKLFDQVERESQPSDEKILEGLEINRRVNLELFPVTHTANKEFYENEYRELQTQRAGRIRALFRRTMERLAEEDAEIVFHGGISVVVRGKVRELKEEDWMWYLDRIVQDTYPLAEMEKIKKSEALSKGKDPSGKGDESMLAEDIGGIDLNPQTIQFRIDQKGERSDGIPNSGLPLPYLEDLPIEGFLPVIIEMTPIPNLHLHLTKREKG